SALPLDEEPAGLLLPLVGGEGSQEVPGIGEAVGTDWSALRAGEARTVVLAHEPAGCPVTQLYLELHAARQKGDLARREIDQAQFRAEAQAAELRDHQQLAVRVVEVVALHRAGDVIEVGGAADQVGDVAAGTKGAHARDKGELLLWRGIGVPTQGEGRCFGIAAGRRAAPKGQLHRLHLPEVQYRGPQPVEPATPVEMAGRGEGGTGKLLGIEAIGAALWRVPAEGQSAFQSFALELVAEAGHVAFVIRARAFCAQEAVGNFAAGGGAAVHRSLRCFLRLQDAAPDLVRLDRLEERPEVAFAETL